MTHMYGEPAIEVEGLRKVYHSLVAVDDVSFVMYRGEAFGFLGPNGAGKSTVVKVLTGLVAPTKGTVRILGQPVSNLEMRRRIGYLPELPTFHRWLHAKEFLEFHGRLYGMRGRALEKRCMAEFSSPKIKRALPVAIRTSACSLPDCSAA